MLDHGDFRLLPLHVQEEMWALYFAGSFGWCLNVPLGGWRDMLDHIEQDRHPKRPEVAAKIGKRTLRSSFGAPVKMAPPTSPPLSVPPRRASAGRESDVASALVYAHT